jgi:hypothetical protein
MLKSIGTFALLSMPAFAGTITPMLINGKLVKASDHPEMVQIRTNGSECGATVVGKQVIITAGHCVKTGDTGEFTYKGKKYKAKFTRHPEYPAKDVDLALGLVAKLIKKAKPMTIGGSATVGMNVEMFGRGCTSLDGSDYDPKELRSGTSVITGFYGTDMVTSMPSGAALCFGDSGSGFFADESGDRVLLGIASKGNIKDTSYATRLDIVETQEFIETFADDKAVDICGVTIDCL